MDALFKLSFLNAISLVQNLDATLCAAFVFFEVTIIV